jgi:hypothetical protein
MAHAFQPGLILSLAEYWTGASLALSRAWPYRSVAGLLKHLRSLRSFRFLPLPTFLEAVRAADPFT